MRTQKASLQLCNECTKVLKDSRFIAAISRSLPEPENRKFVNKRYLSEALVQIFAKYRGLEAILVGEQAEVRVKTWSRNRSNHPFCL